MLPGVDFHPKNLRSGSQRGSPFQTEAESPFSGVTRSLTILGVSPSPSAESAGLIEVLAFQPGHYVAVRWCNLTIVYWMQGATGPIVRRVQLFTEKMSKAYPGGFSSIHLVRNGTPLPDADARQGLAKIMEDYAQQMGCIGVVLMGAGFWASALQGVVTGLSMVARRAFVLRFARDPAEICAWFPAEHHKRTGQTVDAAGLTAAMDHVVSLGERSEREPQMAAV